MPSFDYQAARSEMTDEEIVQFLDTERSEGREYEVDPAAFPALRSARAQSMAAQEPGVEDPGLMDPINYLGGGAAAQGVARGTMGVVRGIGSAFQRPGVKKAAEVGMDVASGGKTAMLRGLGRMFNRQPPGPANVPMPPGATAVPAPPGVGFSQATSTAAQGLPEAVQGRIAAAAGAGAESVPKGMQLVGGYVRRIRGAKPKPATVKPAAKAAETTKPRHSVQYFSKSKGQHLNIEDMNQKHIEQAYRQLAATNPKPGSVARKQLDALMDESKYRLQTTGIHVGQSSVKAAGAGVKKVVNLPQAVQKRIAAVKKAAPRRSRASGESTTAGVPGSLESLLRKSVDLGREIEKRGLSHEQRNTAFEVLRKQME